LHLVGCLYYLYFLRLAKQSQFIPLQNVVYFITFPFFVCKIFTFYINDVLLFKCPIPGPKGLYSVPSSSYSQIANSMRHSNCRPSVSTLVDQCIDSRFRAEYLHGPVCWMLYISITIVSFREEQIK